VFSVALLKLPILQLIPFPLLPVLVPATPDGTYGIGRAIDITVNFSQIVNVTGTPQLSLAGVTPVASYFSGSGSNTLTFRYAVAEGDISPDLDYVSTTALSLSGGTIKNATNGDAILTLVTPGAPNSLGDSKDIVIDGIAPTVTLTSASPTTVNAPFSVTATFLENVTGFDNNTDITVTNATVGNFVQLDAKTYTFDVTPTADGNVTVDVLAATAKDTAGNNNTAATGLTRTADFTAPTVTLTSASPTTVNAPFSVTATFLENVTGFDNNTDITVTNATVGNFVQLDPKTYTFDVTPTAEGNVTVDVLADQAYDTAGNNNTAATGLTRTADFTAPTVTLTSASATQSTQHLASQQHSLKMSPGLIILILPSPMRLSVTLSQLMPQPTPLMSLPALRVMSPLMYLRIKPQILLAIIIRQPLS
jgi:hypothetical protein